MTQVTFSGVLELWRELQLVRKGDGLDPTVIARLQSSLDSLTDDEESRAHFSAVFYTGLFAEHPLYRSLFPAGWNRRATVSSEPSSSS